MKLTRIAGVLAGATLAVAAPLAALTTTAGPAPVSAQHLDAAYSVLGTSFTTPPATWTASEYDGKQFTTNQPDLNNLPKVHAVYMYPADQPDRFAQYGAYFQAEDRRANTILSKGTGMGFRWDERRTTLGNTPAVVQDITVVRARTRLAKFTAASVAAELAGAGLNDPNTKYFVWADVVNNNYICGQTTAESDTQRTAANHANGSSASIAWRMPAPSNYDRNGGFCNPVTHELSHSIGAVLPGSPHWVSGGHCNDDGNDIMCNANSGGSTLAYATDRPRTYDGSASLGGPGDDDYLDPSADLANLNTPQATAKLGYWTVNLSRYLCPRSAADPRTPDCGIANNPSY